MRVCSSPCLTWWKMNIYSPHVLIYSDDQLDCRLFFCFYQHVRKHMFRTFRKHSATVALIHPHFFQGLLKRILWRTPLTRSRRFAPASASVDRFSITGGTRWSLQLWVGSSIPSSMHVYIYNIYIYHNCHKWTINIHIYTPYIEVIIYGYIYMR